MLVSLMTGQFIDIFNKTRMRIVNKLSIINTFNKVLIVNSLVRRLRKSKLFPLEINNYIQVSTPVSEICRPQGKMKVTGSLFSRYRLA